MPKKLTITDIARIAGVSKTTVSRYLNGKFEFMSPVTRDHIRSAIEGTGYQPNNIARSLKSQRSMLIGLVLADIGSFFSNSVAKVIGDAVVPYGYNLIAANCDNSYEREQMLVRSLVNQQVDGLVVNTTQMHNPFLIELANNGLPIVLCDRFVNDYHFDIAYIENNNPVRQVMEHLKQQGFGRIVMFVQPWQQVSPRALRRVAFVTKLREDGAAEPEENVFSVDLEHPSQVGQRLDQLLEITRNDAAPPAILCTNGVTLMHTARAITERRLRMPTQVGLCGYDEWGWASELGWAAMVDVGVTTLTPSLHQLGDLTASMLLERMGDASRPKRQESVEAVLQVRPSTLLRG